MQRDRLIRILGCIALFYWGLDFVNIVLVLHRPSWLLWYSSAGLLFTSVSLLTRNKYLLSSAFCSLFLIEAVWSIEFLQMLLFHHSLFGFTAYAFAPTFGKKDFLMTLYHILIPTSLFVAVQSEQEGWRYGWIGASLFAIVILTATYLFAGENDLVNCIHVHCQTPVSFLYAIPYPFLLFIIMGIFILCIYLPSNFLLVKLQQMNQKQVSMRKKKK